LLLLRNGGGMCGCPFSLIIIINFFIRIYFLSVWIFFFCEIIMCSLLKFCAYTIFLN
jgi:hypothetical protein